MRGRGSEQANAPNAMNGVMAGFKEKPQATHGEVFSGLAGAVKDDPRCGMFPPPPHPRVPNAAEDEKTL